MWYIILAVPVVYAVYWLVKNTHKKDYSSRGLSVVITGGSKGIGYALAREFLGLGDKVVIASRSQDNVESAVRKLKQKYPDAAILGFAPCDIAQEEHVKSLADFTQEKLGRIDYWINNAGCSQSKNLPLTETSTKEIQQIINTNSFGTLLATKIALIAIGKQDATAPGGKKGHVFIMDGGGSNGMTTATFATYGMTKASYPQLVSSLRKENSKSGIGIHLLSPGIVLTELLLKDNTPEPKTLKIFNILSEKPDTVAKWMVPRIRGVRGTGSYIKFLTTPGAMWRFATAWSRKNRFFDPNNYVPKKFQD